MTQPAGQQRETELPKKQVSPKALTRLGHARDAIAVTKKVLNFGAGNQIEALAASQMNSKFRLLAMRTPAYWSLAPELISMAQQNPEALTAAKADLVQGGNCGEHSWIAYDYLRRHAKGDHIARVASEIDHAFVLIGDKNKEPASDVAVSDPWPTNATACLWEDHFCFETKIDVTLAMQADGQSLKGAIAAGLRLSEAGKKAAAQSASPEETKKAVDNYEANHYWNQPDSAAEGKKFNYIK